ncbi:hypothetical protein CC80DRAFT_546457 [Byssothecium circinans]|uniref:Uncharacterized protein n=1 Tax=Byssothecium circinans TaxID=147558 RepID=A0A6A5U2N5_9PLEO|nr:hypothetical protein CC80DRAFT_546457 [Byssothecium circinans]
MDSDEIEYRYLITRQHYDLGLYPRIKAARQRIEELEKQKAERERRRQEPSEAAKMIEEWVANVTGIAKVLEMAAAAEDDANKQAKTVSEQLKALKSMQSKCERFEKLYHGSNGDGGVLAEVNLLRAELVEVDRLRQEAKARADEQAPRIESLEHELGEQTNQIKAEFEASLTRLQQRVSFQTLTTRPQDPGVGELHGAKRPGEPLVAPRKLPRLGRGRILEGSHRRLGL